MSEHADVRITHDAQAHRFEAHVGGEVAVVEYQRRGDSVLYTHTEVPGHMEGQGIGSALARAALDWAREEGLEIVPACPFIAAYVKRHPEYAK